MSTDVMPLVAVGSTWATAVAPVPVPPNVTEALLSVRGLLAQLGQGPK